MKVTCRLNVRRTPPVLRSRSTFQRADVHAPVDLLVRPNRLATKRERWGGGEPLAGSCSVQKEPTRLDFMPRRETRSPSGMEVQQSGPGRSIRAGFPVSLNTRGVQVTRLSSEKRDDYTSTEIIGRLVRWCEGGAGPVQVSWDRASREPTAADYIKSLKKKNKQKKKLATTFPLPATNWKPSVLHLIPRSHRRRRGPSAQERAPPPALPASSVRC